MGQGRFAGAFRDFVDPEPCRRRSVPRHEQEVTTVVAGQSDVGVCRSLVGVQFDRPLDGGIEAVAFEHVGVVPQGIEERVGEGRVLSGGRASATGSMPPEVSAVRERLAVSVLIRSAEASTILMPRVSVPE